MALADEVRKKKAEKERLAQEQSEVDDAAARLLFEYLDELAPEVVAACKEQKYRPQKIQTGPTGLSKDGWVIPVESQEGSAAFAFFLDGDWQFAEPTSATDRFAYRAVPRWAAIRGTSNFLLGRVTKDELQEVIVDFLSAG
jgi:hypothetical protein